MHLDRVAAVDGVVRRSLGAACQLRLDVGGDRREVAGRADDHADRHVDLEDFVQQVGKGQRRQRISAEIGERRVRRHIGGGGPEQCARGPADGLGDGALGAVAPQGAQHVGLAVGEVDVQLLEPLAVELLELRARQLADAGEQSVFEREGAVLDQKSRGIS